MSNKNCIPPAQKPLILVTGDVIRDISVYKGDRTLPTHKGKIEPYFSDLIGGAKDLFKLLNVTCPGSVNWGLQDPSDPSALHAMHALWSACDGGTKQEHDDAPKHKKPGQVWRVENSLGYSLGDISLHVLPISESAKERHSVLVIDDAGLGFRVHPSASSWPNGVLRSQEQPDWIVLKLASPFAQGDLWRALVGGTRPSRRDNLITIVAADELRRAGAAISRGFSWERTLTELCDELNHNPLFQPLLRFPRNLIVNFGCCGAIWFRDGDTQDGHANLAHDRATLVYDPSLPEGGWKTCLADNHAVYGHLNTFTAAIAIAASEKRGGGQPDFNSAIRRGLASCRYLRLLGHGPVSASKPMPPHAALEPLLSPTPSDPVETKAIYDKVLPYGLEAIENPCCRMTPGHTTSWTLSAFAENPPDQPDLPLYGLAHRVALYGYSALRHIPHAQFGSMLSVDREEIETLRSLTLLIKHYDAQKLPKQPLSIAAFGPPGAGKSFGIKQIAYQVLGDDVPLLEFNLSQFDNPADLFGAFHQVRDKALKGRTPVVFWDEFDARDYKWLQYLLAPMQDGTFEENGHTHAIGKCVFVFAGATSWDFEHFGPAPMPRSWRSEYNADPKAGLKDQDPDVQGLAARYIRSDAFVKEEAASNMEFIRKKGPDFLSRLDGHINVLGPNQALTYDWSTRTWSHPLAQDITFPIRRAALLRQFLGAKKPNDVLAIDRDLLRAFLQVPRYSHGARSLEKIAPPLGQSAPPFCRAHLPPHQVLQQHLDTADDFDALYAQYSDFLKADNLVTIAAAVANYFDQAYGSKTPRTATEATNWFEAKMSSKDPWEQWEVATNLAAAQRLPYILALAGLRLEKGLTTPSERKDIEDHLNRHLDPLSREEHALWMQFHLDNGWRQAEPAKMKALDELEKMDKVAYKAEIKRLKTDERIHTMILPFDKLNDRDKPKDYAAIQNYPSTVALVGWKIVFAK